ncbi:hypothetical protein G210_5076, partial [Candida maltosa Xu316]
MTDSAGSLSSTTVTTFPQESAGSTPTEYTTTWTTTNSDGSIVTESGIVEVNTINDGAWYTTTVSTFQQQSTVPTSTEYTTTIVSTSDDGSI